MLWLMMLLLLSSCTKPCAHPVQTTGEHVSCVIDGDTFILSNGEHVRLIGMNTPERGQRGYENATEALVSLLDNRKIVLEKDVSERDKYSRLLRYVYADGEFVNEALVKRGYAKLMLIKPDVSKESILRNAS